MINSIDVKQQHLFKKFELLYSIKMNDLKRYDDPDAGISDGEYKYTHIDHPTIFFIWNETFYNSCWWNIEKRA